MLFRSVWGGETSLSNLVLACYRCNEFKNNRIQAIDAETFMTVALFNPLREAWRDHFEWSENGLRIIGKSAAGRATVDALRMNNTWLVEARELWIIAGVHPELD